MEETENNEFDLESNIETGFEGQTEMEILGITEFAQAEWLFQFDEDEPITIAWSNDTSEPGELAFVLKPDSGSTLVFQSADGKKTLRLFARELTEERKSQILYTPPIEINGSEDGVEI
jgi:hypothetical protein